MAVTTINTDRRLRAISASSGSAHLGVGFHQTGLLQRLVMKPDFSSSVGGRGLGMVEDMGLPLDEFREILAETGYDERPAYVPENEERDKAMLAEFAAMRGRVNRRVLR